MFTGIISALGEVVSTEALALERVVHIATSFDDVILGESIAVNGVCLTATQTKAGTLEFFISTETCSRTNLGKLIVGSRVNLERALILQDRVSGHLVQGHVDGKASLRSVKLAGECHEIKVELPPELSKYTIEKGSICLDGISLTINSIEESVISLMIIPHTWQNTALHQRHPGDALNVEVDMVAKYIERQVALATVDRSCV